MSISAIPVSELTKTKRIDAECYQPQYLENLNFLNSKCKYPVIPLGSLMTSITGGATPLGADYPETGVPFLRVQNIMPGYLDMNGVVYIPSEIHKGELRRSQLHSGDVLLTITGMSYGKAAYVPSNIGEANINQHSVRMALKNDVLPEYVAMFLNSRFGKLQSDKKVTGDTRPALDYEEIRTILLPVPPIADQEVIRHILNEAETKRLLAQQIYAEAERLLSAELGLDQLDLSESLFNVLRMSEVLRITRLDAEYFQSKFDNILISNDKFEYVPLGSLTSVIKNGKTPGEDEYSNTGIPILKVGGLQSGGIIEECDEYVPEEWALENTKGAVELLDCLMLCAAHHPRYIGKTGLLLGDFHPLTRAVGELIIIRFREKSLQIPMSLYFNNSLVQLFIQRLVRGETAHLYPSDLATLPVPILRDGLNQELSQFVQQSCIARQEAKCLLAEAKAEVEWLIEGVGK